MVGNRRRPGGRSGPAGGFRLAAGVVSGAVAVGLCTVLADRFVLHAEWWQVRHTVTADPVAPQSDLGPPPGPLTASWEQTAQMRHGPVAGYGSVAYDVAQGQVVTASGRGLKVLDARTGEGRWSYRRSGWTLLGWSSTGSRLAAYFERDGERGDRLIVGFDALSGALLWRREGERPAAASRTTLRWPAGSGTVLTTDADRRTLTGRSAATGARLWWRRLPAGCRLFEGAAHPADARETLAALALDCAGANRLLALDPADGAVRWNRPLGSAEAPEVSMLDGVTLASDGTALRAFDRHGAQFAAWRGDVCGDGMCPSALAGDRLVVARRPPAPGRAARLEAVDVPSGRSLWRRDAPEYAALAQAGDRIYALRPRLAEPLLPAGVDIITAAHGTPADRAAPTAPAPLGVDPELPGVRPWMAAAGGLLYVAVAEAPPRPEGRARLVALRGGATGAGPAELGGVPESDWPDACALLRRDDLTALHLGSYVARPTRASIGRVRLPRPVSCTYEPRDPEPRRKRGTSPGGGRSGGPDGERVADPDERDRDAPEPAPNSPPGGGPVESPSKSPSKSPSRGHSKSPGTDGGTEPPVRGLTVSVRWVAGAPPVASRLLDALQSTQAQARPRPDIGGDDAYEIGSTAGTIALRVGRLIIVVDAGRPPGVARRIAQTVAQRLRRPA
ncbi:outer membrane protein assembly factor BamB family protein [Actinomadura roseirufa]|uniref:outer membrane protein assembly factor BamB family protein n=1 Tax=Actinomadura roseirufa TaxID=2094049 RepID=UPI0010418640|nr:PQQ-binding-like beta-propeller repeat protein [Actinomadura roseirufa]